MTGIEGAAAVSAAIGKGVAKVAAGDAAQQKAVNTALLDSVKETPEFEAAVHRYGERVALRQGVATGLFRFFARWLPIDREYLKVGIESDSGMLAENLAQKLINIPDDDLQPPRRSVAGPAFEGLGHAVDEPELRDLYLELLARAVDREYAETAHPSFVEVIRQLSSEEVGILRDYLSAQSGKAVIPIVTLNSVVEPGIGIERLYTHLLAVNDSVSGLPVRNDSVPAWVDNWVRLGLVEVTYQSFLSGPGSYDWVQSRPEVVDAQIAVAHRVAPMPPEGQAPQKYQLDIVKGYLSPTAYGASFALAVGMFGQLDRVG